MATVDTATQQDDNRKPALLNSLIAAKPVSVGELCDYANGLPQEWVVATASAIALTVINDYQRGTFKAATRRQLIILGALVTRMAFELERIPQDRDAII